MSFGAPAMLALLLLVPVGAAVYVAHLRRRDRRVEALADQGLVVSGAPSTPRRPRYVPVVLAIVAITLLVAGLARPSATVRTPRREGTIVVAIDTSNSMRADDMKPTRMEAAKEAARALVERQPPTVRIGVVAFGDGAVPVQAPTNDHAAVVAAIDHVSVGGGTALGQGLLTALGTIAGKPVTIDEAALRSDDQQVDIGYFGGATVVAITDGENTNPPDPMSVADVASVAGVRVHAIGVGTEEGTSLRVDGFNVATALDSGQLKDLAERADGTYHRADDEAGVLSVAEAVRSRFKVVSEHTEITGLFTAAALALLLIAALTSLRLFGRVAW
jgi:Ca-activated chloride channel family protein